MAFAIRQERVAVGRDADNDIRLPEAAVSARHAVVITRMGLSTVHDLNSSNGTWVNGKRIESQQLRHGDVVQFGRLSMNYIDESDAVGRQPGNAPTQRNATVSLRTSPQHPAMVNPNAAVPPPPAAVPDTPDLAELDRLMGSIRSFRSGEAKQNDQKRNEMLEEWKKVMGYCGALKTRLASEPKVRYFEISDRRNEVVVRIERVPGQPTQLLMLSWGHMEQRERAEDGIWMRQPGQADKRYEKCAEAMRDLVTTIAHMVA